MTCIDFENEKPLEDRLIEFATSLIEQAGIVNSQHLLDEALSSLYTLKLMERTPTLSMISDVFASRVIDKSNSIVHDYMIYEFEGMSGGQYLSITASSSECKNRLMTSYFFDSLLQKRNGPAIFLSSITVESFLIKLIVCIEKKITQYLGICKRKPLKMEILFEEFFRLVESSKALIDFHPTQKLGEFGGTVERLRSKYDTKIFFLDSLPAKAESSKDNAIEQQLRLIAERFDVALIQFKVKN